MYNETPFQVNCWIPMKASESEIVDVLQLSKPKECTFEIGIGETFGDFDRLVISHSINGWRLVLGSNLGDLGLQKSVCSKLSQIQKNVILAGRDFWVPYHCWMVANAGKVIRYMYWDAGDVTEEGLPLYFEEDLEYDVEWDYTMSICKNVGFDFDWIEEVDFKKECNTWHIDK